jgi:glycosidase
MQGFLDPFCRGFYPWGEENTDLLEFYKALGKFRTSSKAFSGTEYIPVLAEQGVIAYIRKNEDSLVFVAVNLNDNEQEIGLPQDFSEFKVCFGKEPDNLKLTLKKREFSLISK